MGVDGVCVAVFCASDSVREEAAEAVALLHGMGIKTVMLTGDNSHAAQGVQLQTNVMTVRRVARHQPNRLFDRGWGA